jgi:nucleoside-diphosphate-sugar epimerase
MLDVTKVRDVLGWTAETSIRDGLKKTVDWYNADLDRAGAA